LADPEKAEVERLKKVLSGLLKDPEMAKKAALILENWLHEKSD